MATEALRPDIAGRALTIRRFGRDRYGRTLAVIYADGVNTSCSQVENGNAAYVERWDRSRSVAAECGFE